MHVFFILFLFFVPSFGSHEDLPATISQEVEHLKETQKVSKLLKKSVKEFGRIRDRERSNELLCQTCELVLTTLIQYRRQGASKESVRVFLTKQCQAFSDWGNVACNGYVNIEIDTILYIIDNNLNLTPAKVCSIYFQQKGCQDSKANKWVVPLPPVPHLSFSDEPSSTAANLKILQLTDFHYDALYSPGSNAKCDVPLCCQATNGKPANQSDAAGFWGDYRVCDMPWHTVTNFTNYINSTKDISYDYVYYTGDIISHKSWATDKDGNTKAIKDLFNLFNQTFKQIPVFPILGNHEPHPTDFYSTPNVTETVSTQWIFDLAASEWARWLPAETKTTILTGGYYTFLLPGKNLRIVALNSNVCFTSNLWLLHHDEDPYNQLKWLVQVLTQAEKNKERVHILSHIPPGEVLCASQWANQYRRIVQRFAPIIAAQFNGHTHLDELRLFPDVNNTNKIVNVAYNAGSFTTFVGFNPNFRIYAVDPSNFTVVDYDHYTFNLTQANLDANKSPQWFKLYSFKSAYGLKDTTLASLGDLVHRLATNKTLAMQYFRFQGRESDAYLAQGCNDLCLRKLVCAVTAVETDEAIKCQLLTKKRHQKV